MGVAVQVAACFLREAYLRRTLSFDFAAGVSRRAPVFPKFEAGVAALPEASLRPAWDVVASGTVHAVGIALAACATPCFGRGWVIRSGGGPIGRWRGAIGKWRGVGGGRKIDTDLISAKLRSGTVEVISAAV
jgi:hypothetical protein